MGGSIAAARCSEAGLSVLVLEKGAVAKWDGRKKGIIQRLKTGYDDGSGERWPTPLLVRSSENARYRETDIGLGIGPGGSARIYGAALGRASRADFDRDFQPANWPGPFAADTPALPNSWPVDFDEFTHSYSEAERILSPVGSRDPLDPDDDAVLAAPPPISPAHEALVDALKGNGRHPFRMHVGIAYKPGCSECQGSSCPRDCKAHGFNRALQPEMAANQRIVLEQNAAVRSISRAKEGQWTVHCGSAGDQAQDYSAPNLVLAAGALNTPRLLEASASLWGGVVPRLVGRGLMFHANEIFAVSTPRQHSLHGPRKVLAFRDHYFDGDLPLAECQSLGLVANPALIAAILHRTVQLAGMDLGALGKLVTRPAGEIGHRLYQGAELFTAAIQDLPYEDNRVTSVRDSEGRERVAVTYNSRSELVERTKRFRALMKEAFGPNKVRFPLKAGQPNYGHPMGSCRMGGSPEESVVDATGQVWDQPGLYVADASAFASSLGINPALTVAAHAIRVADALVDRSSTRDERA